jgi:hypothetical protein
MTLAPPKTMHVLHNTDCTYLLPVKRFHSIFVHVMRKPLHEFKKQTKYKVTLYPL